MQKNCFCYQHYENEFGRVDKLTLPENFETKSKIKIAKTLKKEG